MWYLSWSFREIKVHLRMPWCLTRLVIASSSSFVHNLRVKVFWDSFERTFSRAKIVLRFPFVFWPCLVLLAFLLAVWHVSDWEWLPAFSAVREIGRVANGVFTNSKEVSIAPDETGAWWDCAEASLLTCNEGATTPFPFAFFVVIIINGHSSALWLSVVDTENPTCVLFW